MFNKTAIAVGTIMRRLTQPMNLTHIFTKLGTPCAREHNYVEIIKSTSLHKNAS